MVAEVAGLVAGATAMAAGEYVSVNSQSDTEAADLTKERHELAEQPDAELRELTNIYVERGLDTSLARQVAEALTAKDAFAAHARDELGLSGHVCRVGIVLFRPGKHMTPVPDHRRVSRRQHSTGMTA